MDTNKIIEFYIDNNILISPELLSEIDNPLPLTSDFIVLNKDVLKIIKNKKQILAKEFEKAIVLKEKYKNAKHYDRFIEFLDEDLVTNPFINSISKINSTIPNSNNNIIKNTEIEKPELKLKDAKNKEEEKISSNALIIEEHLEEKKSNLENSDSVIDNLDRDIQNAEKSLSRENTSEEEKLELKLKDAKNKEEEKIIRDDFLKRNKIKIVSSYTTKSKKWVVNDFVNVYISRFKELEKILRSRQELQNLTSISKIVSKKDRENVAFIGVVYEKSITKNGNIMFNIEDQTGRVKVVVSKTKDQLFKLAEEIQLDETIGVTGTFDQIVFASNLLFPDIPLTKELKKSPDEGYIVIISDTQFGGKLFLEKEFNKFISWINGDLGNDKQKNVALNVKYIFIGGDLVEGVGIYPNQEYDLSVINVHDQYAGFAEFLKKIPTHIPIIVCPGNHDVGRISEPQLPLSRVYASAVVDLPNVVSVSNPSMINIYSQPENNFDGLDIMFYHGYSFIYYSEHIPTIRQSGGQKRPDLIMKYLLQRRHLAPAHTSTMYIPDPKKDPLLIDKIPDILITGHIHRSSVSSYKNVTCFNASCWVAKSDEQERRGLEPQPGRAFIVDMHTREVKVMNFLSKEDQDKEAGIIPVVLEENNEAKNPIQESNNQKTNNSESQTAQVAVAAK